MNKGTHFEKENHSLVRVHWLTHWARLLWSCRQNDSLKKHSDFRTCKLTNGESIIVCRKETSNLAHLLTYERILLMKSEFSKRLIFPEGKVMSMWVPKYFALFTVRNRMNGEAYGFVLVLFVLYFTCCYLKINFAVAWLLKKELVLPKKTQHHNYSSISKRFINLSNVL